MLQPTSPRQNVPGFWRIFALSMSGLACAGAALAVFGLGACSTSQPRHVAPTPPDYPSEPPQGAAKRLWSTRVAGLITHIAAAGDALFVTAVPDRAQGASAESAPASSVGERVLMRLDSAGQVLWARKLSSGVKGLVVSPRGDRVAVSLEKDGIAAFDGEGKPLWATTDDCRLIAIGAFAGAPDPSGGLLCIREEAAPTGAEARPRGAVERIGWDGKQTGSVLPLGETLAAKVSRDEMFLMTAHSTGWVMVFDRELKPVAKIKVAGEVLDVASSGGAQPLFAVLSHSNRTGQKLQVYRRDGILAGEGKLGFQADQLEFADGPSDRGTLLLSGNGPKGQFVAGYVLPAGLGAEKGQLFDLKESWRKGARRFADYATTLLVAGRLAVMGVEDPVSGASGARERKCRVLGVGTSDGQVAWEIPLTTREGAYIFAVAGPRLISATDDSVLSYFEVSAAP